MMGCPGLASHAGFGSDELIVDKIDSMAPSRRKDLVECQC